MFSHSPLAALFAATTSALTTTPSPTPGYWVHDIDPFLVQFSNGVGIRWYGLAYVVTFLIGAWLLSFYYKRGKSPLNPDRQAVLMYALIGGVLIGARLGEFLLYQREALLRDPLAALRVWEGGMSSHGGMAGVWIALGIFCWATKTRFWQLLDIIVTGVAPGFLFGRIANFINGELWGRETDVSWAVIFKLHTAGDKTLYLLPRHPSQLYASVLEGGVMLAFLQWRFWKFRLPAGQLVGEAMVAYAIVRIIGEVYREPDATDFLPVWLTNVLSPGQFYSVILGVLGVAVILRARIWGQVCEVQVPEKREGKRDAKGAGDAEENG